MGSRSEMPPSRGSYSDLSAEQQEELSKLIVDKLRSLIGGYGELTVLAEYIAVMLQSSRAADSIRAELEAFLQDQSRPFTRWLMEQMEALLTTKEEEEAPPPAEPQGEAAQVPLSRAVQHDAAPLAIADAPPASKRHGGRDREERRAARAQERARRAAARESQQQHATAAASPVAGGGAAAGGASREEERARRAAGRESQQQHAAAAAAPAAGGGAGAATASHEEAEEEAARQGAPARRSRSRRRRRKAAAGGAHAAVEPAVAAGASGEERDGGGDRGCKVVLTPNVQFLRDNYHQKADAAINAIVIAEEAEAVAASQERWHFRADPVVQQHAPLHQGPPAGAAAVGYPPPLPLPPAEGNGALVPQQQALVPAAVAAPAASPHLMVYGAPPPRPAAALMSHEQVPMAATPQRHPAGAGPGGRAFAPKKWRVCRPSTIVRATEQLESEEVRTLNEGEIVEQVAPAFTMPNGIVRVQIRHPSSPQFPSPIGWVTRDATSAGGPRFLEPGPEPMSRGKPWRPPAGSAAAAGAQQPPGGGAGAAAAGAGEWGSAAPLPLSWRGGAGASAAALSPGSSTLAAARPRGAGGPGLLGVPAARGPHGFQNLVWTPSSAHQQSAAAA